MKLMLFRNGMCAAFDDKGEQIPVLQRSFVELWADHAVKHGFQPGGVIVEGYDQNWRIIKTESGWNFEAVSRDET